MNKLKKMALKLIVESLSDEEIAGLRKMFKAMDTDYSGAITFSKLKAGLSKFGSMLEDTEIRDLMDVADMDNNGTMDYVEFLAATIYMHRLDREEHLVPFSNILTWMEVVIQQLMSFNKLLQFTI